MKIIQLQAENVKKLKAVTIKPETNMVVVGGNNEQGKTSTLDSIAFALGGKSLFDKQPVRKGTKEAKIVCDLGELVVTRVIKANGGGSLTVSSANGQTYTSPQALLDSLTGKITFDPLAFAQMDSKKQLETLKTLVGLDFTELDQERKRLYDTRTVVNNEVKSLKNRIDSMPKDFPPDLKEVNVSDLTNQLKKIQEHNKEQEQLKNFIAVHTDKIQADRAEIERLQERIAELEASIVANTDIIESLRSSLQPLIEDDAIIRKIQEADTINQKVRQQRQYEELRDQYIAKSNEADDLTSKIEQLDSLKQEMLASAKFPIEGLGFDENGVTHNGIPFEQCSGAEKLRVSTAMGMALNPKLKVMLIRDGSLLDPQNLDMLRQMAETNDFQVWIERVGEGEECSVVIEEGVVKR